MTVTGLGLLLLYYYCSPVKFHTCKALVVDWSLHTRQHVYTKGVLGLHTGKVKAGLHLGVMLLHDMTVWIMLLSSVCYDGGFLARVCTLSW